MRRTKSAQGSTQSTSTRKAKAKLGSQAHRDRKVRLDLLGLSVRVDELGWQARQVPLELQAVRDRLVQLEVRAPLVRVAQEVLKDRMDQLEVRAYLDRRAQQGFLAQLGRLVRKVQSALRALWEYPALLPQEFQPYSSARQTGPSSPSTASESTPKSTQSTGDRGQLPEERARPF